MKMKRILIISLAFTLLAACENNPAPPEAGELNLTKKSLELLEADNAFGLDLFSEVMSETETGENVMISPLSVALALGMTLNGAATTTREAMEQALRLQGFTQEEINQGYKSIIDQLLDLDPKVIMEIANSIWYRDDFSVLEDFIHTNQEYFYAEIRSLDFSAPGAKDIINGWVSEKTHEKIREIIDEIPAQTVMYLINAIYFKGMWTFEFDPEDTGLKPFYPAEGPSFNALAMRQETELNYYHNDLFQLVELPYGDRNFSMLVFLPSAGKSCSDILAGMDNDSWNSWTGQLAETDVLVQLPKFKFETFKLLNEYLSSMGMEIAFTDAADFTGINPAGNLYISRVLHKTYIDVNEEGTEAAAVTAVEVGFTSVGPNPGPVRFIADRPFLFAIRENSTGSILFMGRLSYPEY
jgi:serine protease inhibitor